MKQKIVIKIQMHCEKCRNKALKIAAEVQGVTSVALEGDDKDRVVVTGDNVNTICLVNLLNKKFKCVTVLTVEEVKKKEEKKEEKKACCCVVCFAAPQCAKCEGKCEHCSKCQSAKCQCKCVIICSKCEGKCEKCSKCQNPQCQCKCVFICVSCQSSKCDGACVITCFKCKSPKCDGQCCSPLKPPPQPCIQCPPWCTCPRCYVPCNPPPCTYRVVYDSNPDNCSIM